MGVQIIQGNALDLPLADNTVDLVVTSPPYFGLRSYQDGGEHYAGQLGSEATPTEFVDALIAATREMVRVTKPSGSIFVNLGDKYAQTEERSRNGNDNRKATDNFPSGSVLRGPTVTLGRKNNSGVRPKSLIGIPWRYALRCIDDLGLILRAEIIWAKCLSGGTQVYARVKGRPVSILLKDLARYDVEDVELWTGDQWSRVLRMDPTPPTEGRSASSLAARQARYRGKPIPALTADLELEFRNGERVGCTPNHKWPTQRGDVRADELVVGDVIGTGQLPDERTEVPGLPDEDIGWFVGMYLAEGSRSEQTIQLAGHIREHDRNKRLAEIAAAYHGTCKVFQTSDNGMTANLTGTILRSILDTYIGGKTAKDKRLSPKCWQRSNTFLDALLRGYLEGDGYSRNNEWRVNFTANDGLAADLRTLGARLGLSVWLRRTVHRIGESKYPGWTGSIRSPETRRYPDGLIVAIRQSRARQFWNIEIADEPHTFALASGTRTKNSNGLPESVTDRVRRSHEVWFHFVQRPRYYSAVDEIREEHAQRTIDQHKIDVRAGLGGSVGGFRGVGAEGRRERSSTPEPNPLGKLPGSVWTIPTQPLSIPDHISHARCCSGRKRPGCEDGTDHFAAYPMEWPRRIIRGWSPAGVCVECGEGRRPISSASTVFDKARDQAHATEIAQRGAAHGVMSGGTARSTLNGTTTRIITGEACACPDTTAPTTPGVVLDPFGGTGTTTLVAHVLGRNAVSVDMSADYCRLARWRTSDPGELARARQVDKPAPQVDGQADLFTMLEGEGA